MKTAGPWARRYAQCCRFAYTSVHSARSPQTAGRDGSRRVPDSQLKLCVQPCDRLTVAVVITLACRVKSQCIALWFHISLGICSRHSSPSTFSHHTLHTVCSNTQSMYWWYHHSWTDRQFQHNLTFCGQRHLWENSVQPRGQTWTSSSANAERVRVWSLFSDYCSVSV